MKHLLQLTLRVVRSLPDSHLAAPASVRLWLALAIGSLCPCACWAGNVAVRDSVPPAPGPALKQYLMGVGG